MDPLTLEIMKIGERLAERHEQLVAKLDTLGGAVHATLDAMVSLMVYIQLRYPFVMWAIGIAPIIVAAVLGHRCPSWAIALTSAWFTVGILLTRWSLPQQL